MSSKINDFGYFLLDVCMSIMVAALLINFLIEVWERFESSGFNQYFEKKYNQFLAMRRYKRDRKYFLSQNYTDLLAEYQKKEHDSRVERINPTKGAE